MDLGTLESAYEALVATLREGGFEEPAEGWPAELVAAHLARNNELISEVAERIVAGEEPRCDNRTAVDDAELRAFKTRSVGSQALGRQSKPPLGDRRELGLPSTTRQPVTCCLF